MTLFQIGFLTVTIIDIVDIVIVAFLLYRLYAVMRGTIAAQIFVGLVLIIGVGFVSQMLNMIILSAVLRTVRDLWVVALIILFQPELRRILLMVGRRGVFTSFDRVDINYAVDEIISAAEDLAFRQYGALIIVARTSNLSLSFDTGMVLDSKLSKEMLVSIFNPKAPLHDGAVVVNGDMIRSARVVLPLSATTRLDDVLLGTRHRAGLGISEQADVFVVIVSEEKGSVSYAYEGKLYFNRSLDAVRLALLSVMDMNSERWSGRRFVRNILDSFSSQKSPVPGRRSARTRRASASDRNS